MHISELQNKKIAILGFGKEGKSGYDFFQKNGIEVLAIHDKKDISFELQNLGFSGKFYTGNTYLQDLDTVDYIFKSPGVSPFSPELLAYRKKFISGTQIFFENYTGKVIGITGTKGKSTLSTLIFTLLQASGFDTKLVGNIGNPVLSEISFSDSPQDFVVYELSSYMLQDFSPNLEIGVLNNIYPCHLDWHYNSMNIYKEAKVNVLRNARTKIVNGELAGDCEINSLKESKIFFASKGKYRYDTTGFYVDGMLVYSGKLKLLGEHNKGNICACIAVLDSILQDKEKLKSTLECVLPNFSGLSHRIEDIGIYEGIQFIDDAIATTPESTIAAIQTFEQTIQTLFLGGQDSGFDFGKIRNIILDSSIQNIIAFPDTSEKIFPEIEFRAYEKSFEIEIEGKILHFFKTKYMKSGVDFAFRTTLPGKTALLSCAAPSFSLWTSYIHKAQEFVDAVKKY